MKKNEIEDELRGEYDLSKLKNRCVGSIREGTDVLLDPECIRRSQT